MGTPKSSSYIPLHTNEVRQQVGKEEKTVVPGLRSIPCADQIAVGGEESIDQFLRERI